MPLCRIPDDSLSAWSRVPPDPHAISLLGVGRVHPHHSRTWRIAGLSVRIHGRPVAKPTVAAVWGPEKPGHHRRLLGDLFLERKRLEIRMMGENISGRWRHRAESALRVARQVRTDIFTSSTSLHTPLSPSPQTFLLRFALLRPLRTPSPISRPRSLNLSRYGLLPSIA